MDPALLKQKEAFKKRAMAVPVVEKKKEVAGKSSSAPKKKKKSKLKRPKSSQPAIGGMLATQSVHLLPHSLSCGCRGSGQAKAVGAVWAAEQHALPCAEGSGGHDGRTLHYQAVPASLSGGDPDRAGADRTPHRHTRVAGASMCVCLCVQKPPIDLSVCLSAQALKANTKIIYYPAGETFLFKVSFSFFTANPPPKEAIITRVFPMQPTLGLEVRNRKQLLERLRENDREGLGGIPMSEIREALHNPDKAVTVSKSHTAPLLSSPPPPSLHSV